MRNKKKKSKIAKILTSRTNDAVIVRSFTFYLVILSRLPTQSPFLETLEPMKRRMSNNEPRQVYWRP